MIAAALLGPATFAACGELDSDFRGATLVRPPPPSQPHIDRLAVETPERTLLQWCRDLQRAREVSTRWPTAFLLFRVMSCPRIVDITTEGDRATAYAVLTTRWEAPNGRVDARSQPQAFHLVRRRGAWSVVDDPLLSTAGGTAIVRNAHHAPLPRMVTAQDIQARPAGSAERAALRLLRALQFNDPLAAAPAFGPAWRLSPKRIARYLRNHATEIRSWGVPRIVAVRRRGQTVEIVALPTGVRQTFVFRRTGRRWRLVQYRAGDVILPDRTPTAGR